MADEMFFSRDRRSLRRGKRRAARTPTCRPCKLWPKDAPGMEIEGVVVDTTPYGMCIRMLEIIPPGTSVMVQLMRDEDFCDPLSTPIGGMVVRSIESEDGFVDHGVELHRAEMRRAENLKPVKFEARRTIPYVRRGIQSRMHTADLRSRRGGR